MLRKFRPPNALLMGTPGEKGMEEQEQEAQKPKANWRKRGPKPRPKAELRRHPVTCRVTDAELAEIDDRRPEGMTRGEWLRTAALRRAPAKCAQDGSWNGINDEQLRKVNDYLWRWANTRECSCICGP